jgi:exodeoxyribonuclease V alpha subunit
MGLDWLEEAERARLLRPLDRHFALRILDLSRSMGSDPMDRGPVVLAAALVSRTTGEGHVCLDLGEVAGRAPFAEAGLTVRAPPVAAWRAALGQSGVVGAPGEPTPLVLDRKDRLYLGRYWRFEQELAAALRARAAGWAAGVDQARLAADLRRLFPARSTDGDTDWQAVAAALAVLRRLTVVSGGPGTGKTRTVAAILALLVAQGSERVPRVALAAPTGKAAARLAESVRQARAELPLSPEERAGVPEDAATLHRLLGTRPGRPGFRHDAANPLHLDVLVVDEASMVDLPLMARTVAALPPGARLILLGDRDQLASVEAGAVLGDLCGPDRHPGYAPEVATVLRQVTGAEVPVASRSAAGVELSEASGTADGRGLGAAAAGKADGRGSGESGAYGPLADGLVLLRRSFRFGPDSGIGVLAARVQAGDAAGVLALLARARQGEGTGDSAGPEATRGVDAPSTDSRESGGGTQAPVPAAGSDGRPENRRPEKGRGHDLAFEAFAEPARAAAVERRVLPCLRAVFEAPGPSEALVALGRFRVLCALREGPWGAGAFNGLTERALGRAGLVPRTSAGYRGRPVMVTRNDYGLGLFNGDVGVLWPDAAAGGALRAFFPVAGGGLRAVPPGRLPAHETVYAMTVHKSQGSEFDEVLLVLPDRPLPLLTRELVYTAVTRARSRVEIWGPESVVRAAVDARVRRTSGLRDALWEGASPSLDLGPCPGSVRV